LNNMTIRFNLVFIFILHLMQARAQELQKIGHLAYDPVSLAGCWHYVDSTGGEWALVGTSAGLSLVDLNDPAQPAERFAVPGIQNNWREVKTWAGFAYVGSEAYNSGITIVDLRELPDTIQYRTWYGDSTNVVIKSHALQAEDGYLYLFGGLGLQNGAFIADLADPWNPVIIGVYPIEYVHDGFIRGDTLWTSEIYKGRFGVVDITDRTAPVLLNTQPTPGAFNHNSGLNDAGNVLFTTDEVANAPLAAFDVSDIDNITLLDTYKPTRKPTGEVHNVRVIRDFLVNPSYRGQLTIVDATQPDNMVEIGWDSLGTSLVWDADPYLPSGIIFATAKKEGLFIYKKPDYRPACRIEGQITDAQSGALLSNAKVFLTGTYHADTTMSDGVYKTGVAIPGVYQLLVTREGYQSATVNNVNLFPGVTINRDIQLEPLSSSASDNREMTRPVITPVPFRDYLRVENMDAGCTMELFDINGRKTGHSDGTSINNLGEYPPGLYRLVISQSGVPIYEKAVLKSE
jgi:choice-of-anchor B domain-containing protein